ncbi:AAA domain (dynein-related subfamily) [Flavobacterium segetis]|uniref:AAA domain (Dynein-related subfamily) n=1 Tax=Flavobacterium segetis TaxID=271157 RepID=A0A1M5JKN3_9FLAO|nr:AAA family ATPase [Flavobacterium segetis]SHG40819.1 AAA domain (dynein-related subfamily) [Flavobacterium segetis]
MSKIIIKKSNSTSWENKTGLVLPIFKIESNEFTTVEPKEYPNNGNIFVTIGFERFENNCFYELNADKIQDNTKNYENDLKAFLDGNTTKNPSFKIITNHNGDTRKLAPNEIIPIYHNKFSINSNKLITTEGIINDIFFLKETSSDKIFGPFERDGNELKAANFKNYEEDFEKDIDFLDFIDSYNHYNGTIIFDIDTENATNFIIVDIEKNEFLVGFKNFIDNSIGNPIDFTPIPILHKWAIDKLTENSPKIASTLNEIKSLQKTNNNKIDKLKWNKYISLLDEIEDNEKEINDLVKILHTKNFIEKGIDSSEIEILEKEKEDIRIERDSKDKVIITLKDRIKELNIEIEEDRSKNKENNKIDSVLYPILSKAINVESKLNEIEQILKEKVISNSLKSENDRLSIRKDLLEEDIKKIENNHRKINDAVKDITKTFERSASEHTAKLAEAKIYTDLLNGIEIMPIKIHTEVTHSMKAKIISLNSEISSPKNYISEIQKRLADQGRELVFNDVANLVITINQTFITIIAGAPGVGKTSLVEKLSKSYGLSEDFGYLEIACAKGWTSAKDLIGFFNPLTNKFQPAKTKLKEALKKSEEKQNSPYIVLLDEANLSPIEHYWSDFIKLADVDYPRKIKISEGEEINFGSGFRFVATINHDHTTETLSNRLIDRASIVQLEKPNSITEITENTTNIDTIFDFLELQKLFTETPKWKTEEELIKDTFNKIKEKLESNHTIIISPRKEIAIYKYCKVATGLMEGNSYVALDYAISQHILPLINGRGESFQKLLEGLKSDLNDKGMTKSEKLLTKIIERGKELKHFRYIYY